MLDVVVDESASAHRHLLHMNVAFITLSTSRKPLNHVTKLGSKYLSTQLLLMQLAGLRVGLNLVGDQRLD
jgi:hypothetical protein